jgi:small subunit ribosomal protein S16
MRRPLLVRPAWLICAVLSAVSPVGAGPPPRIYRWEKTTAVAVKIKLKRLGKIREPYYRIVVADARTKRDGRAIEEIGKYHPKAEPSFIEVNSERVQHWLSVGAQPTDPVRVLLKITGDWQKFKGESGAEGTLRTAEPRADKKAAFEAAAKESQATKDAKEAKESRGGSRSARSSSAKDSAPKDSAPKDSAAKSSSAKAGRANAADAGTDAPAEAEAAPATEATTVTEAAPAAEATAEAAPAAEATTETEAAPAAEATTEAEPAAEAAGTEA